LLLLISDLSSWSSIAAIIKYRTLQPRIMWRGKLPRLHYRQTWRAPSFPLQSYWKKARDSKTRAFHHNYLSGVSSGILRQSMFAVSFMQRPVGESNSPPRYTVRVINGSTTGVDKYNHAPRLGLFALRRTPSSRLSRGSGLERQRRRRATVATSRYDDDGQL